MIRVSSKLEPFIKLNSKRSETDLERHAAYATKMIRVGSKLEPFIKLNSKRSETKSGTQPRSILNSKRSETESGTQRDQNDPSRFENESILKH